MGSNFNWQVGSRIYKARKALGMTRAELGQKVNLHETTIKRYEDGDIKTLDIEKIKEFAEALNVSGAFLLDWDIADKNTVLSAHDAWLLKKYRLLDLESKEAIDVLLNKLAAKR